MVHLVFICTSLQEDNFFFPYYFFCQPYTDEIVYYYVIETGFYISLIISLFVDVKRKVCFACNFITLSFAASCDNF